MEEPLQYCLLVQGDALVVSVSCDNALMDRFLLHMMAKNSTHPQLKSVTDKHVRRESQHYQEMEYFHECMNRS